VISIAVPGTIVKKTAPPTSTFGPAAATRLATSRSISAAMNSRVSVQTDNAYSPHIHAIASGTE
jgi:hypothetical protein